ncbi:low molecular weight protein-tyrosine-phosphatase [Haliea sp. E1-2-M8]|uniref:low molecular weight protein-tyrosine-phosphatase n=1 Tax=Haliea sp. E1-2-M8 TaxID=3064706 RepID=UPI002728E17C|nr:low molecular weight protein-tyrosine-phosphatase [Haliea sp. E1-2-M8]MDO8860440.1 low molecular weight protein-tyrosine-phosphatase [Haliea sp. E1-2-M8]
MSWWRPELRVLFICTANVCRSPLAEAMLRQRLRVLGLGRRVQVRSAGTRVGQPGRPPDPRVRKLAQDAGFALGWIRARQVTARMLRNHDFILAMEPAHLEELAALAEAGDRLYRTQLLGNYLPLGRCEDPVIPDPYYSDLQGFSEVFMLLDEAMEGFVEHLQARLRKPT